MLLSEENNVNVLIVEGKEDKAFIDYLLNDAINVKVENPPEILELSGLSKEALKVRIGSLKRRIESNSIEKLGIVIDLDTFETEGGFKNRLKLVNDAIKESFKESFDVTNISDLTDASQFIKVPIDNNTEIEIACFFIHIDNKGELEDVLREIKTHESSHADCLEAWNKCLKAKSIEKTDKEINKLWLQIFIRYDICSKEEQKNARECCKLEYVLENKNDVFDFDHECLNELKAFLEMFK